MKTFGSIVLLLIYMILCISGASAAITYKSYVDLDYGFYKVVGIDVKPINDTEQQSTNFTTANYTDKNLTINVGDTVMWTNYDIKDWPITIMSKQGLWNEKDSYLKWSYTKFNYTFNESGRYDIFVKDNDRLHQTIVVNPIDTQVTHVIEDVKIPEPTEIPVKETSVYTPEVTLTEGGQRNTSDNTSPGLYKIIIFCTILIILYFLRKALTKK